MTPETAAAAPKPESRQDLPWILGALTAIFLVGLPSILYPFHPDHAMFATIGDRWLHGGLPYRDAWDVKPPGIFALYALAQVVFGRGMAAARWMDLVLTLTAAYFLYRIARRSLPSALAALAPLLFALVYFTAFDFQDSAQSESFGAAFISAYAWMLLRAADSGRGRWLLGAGFLLGCSALLKTTFVMFLLLTPLACPGGGFRRFASRIGLVIGGAVIPVGVTVAYFAVQGAAGYLVELLAAQKAYGSLPDSASIAKAFRSTSRFFRERPVVVMLFALAAIQLAGSLRKRNPQSALLWGWAVIAAAMVAIQWRCHSYHFLVLLPPLALLGARTLASLWQGAPSAAAQSRPFALAITSVVLLLPMVYGVRRIGFAVRRATGQLTAREYWSCFAAPGWYPFENSAETAAFVRGHTSPTEPVLVFDYDPAIYFLSERRCPTRHLSSEPIIGEFFFPESVRSRWKAELVRDVEKCPPQILVVGNCPHCVGLAEEHTFAPKTVSLGGHRFELLTHITKDRIYRLADSGAVRVSSGVATAEMRSRIRTTASGE